MFKSSAPSILRSKKERKVALDDWIITQPRYASYIGCLFYVSERFTIPGGESVSYHIVPTNGKRFCFTDRIINVDENTHETDLFLNADVTVSEDPEIADIFNADSGRNTAGNGNSNELSNLVIYKNSTYNEGGSNVDPGYIFGGDFDQPQSPRGGLQATDALRTLRPEDEYFLRITNLESDESRVDLSFFWFES